MPPSIYENLINLVVLLFPRRGPGKFDNFVIMKYCILTAKLLYPAVYYSKVIIITIFVLTLFPDYRFENIFSAYVRVEITQQNFYIVPGKLIRNTP
jgi:hypothetical protein